MIIYPAVDIKNGKCVRLYKGEFDKAKVYFEDPVIAAKMWQDAGAQWIHIVDLDGAASGRIANIDTLKSILDSVDSKIQFGGGIRSYKTAVSLIEMGVDRIVISTKALDDKKMIMKLCGEYNDNNKIAIAVDANGDKIFSNGWLKQTDVDVDDYVSQMEQLGVKLFIYTQIKRDGTLKGPDIAGLRQICSMTKGKIIASGGIGSLNDIRNLLGMENEGVCGVIVGKALYEKSFTLESAVKLAKH